MGLGAVVKEAVARVAPRAFVVRGPAGIARQVALTFDDGPHPEHTPRILDALDMHGVKGTFFVQGDMAERHPAILRETVRRGHQIGNHGYSHQNVRARGGSAYVADVLRTQQVVENTTGCAQPKFFRPPYGSITLPTTLALLHHGFRFIFWTLDSRDSFVPDAATMLAYLDAQRIEPGCIVLMHDDYRHTAEALGDLVVSIRRRDLAPVSVAALVGHAL